MSATLAGPKLVAPGASPPGAAARVIDPRIVEMRQRCDVRLAELRTDRTTFELDWREISELIVPQRGRYIAQTMPRRPRRVGHRILDPTATKAHQRLAAFCMAGITNPALSWFRLGVGDDAASDDPAVKEYLAECQRRMFRVLSSGNFYNSLHQVYEEIAAFGTGAMICLQDYHDVMRFYPLTTGEYYLALDERQEVGTLYREYSLTIAQIVAQFGYENCSTSTQSLYDARRLSGMVIVIHAIERNLDRKPGKAGQAGKLYTSAYFERGIVDRFLKLEGFDQKPFIAPRWSALSGDAYGQGPGLQAMPDVKSLQVNARQLTEAGEKLVNPPVQGDSRYQSGYLGLLPGDVNWLTGLDTQKDGGLRPIFQVPPNVSVLQASGQAYRDTIKETFFNDLILSISQMDGVQPRNEMEINERRTEKMLMLGPMLERFYSEALAPVIRIVFDVMQRGRLMPPPPPALHGLQIEPGFISVLAQAQKAVGTSSLEQFLKFTGSLAGIWQGVIDIVDSDAVVTEYGADLEINPKLIRDPAAVQAMRADAAQKAQMAQLLQATPALAQAGKTAASIMPGGAAGALGQQGGTGGGGAQ